MPEVEDLEISRIGLSIVVKGQRLSKVTFKDLANLLMKLINRCLINELLWNNTYLLDI